MGLRILETKLSLQGALSGAADVSSAGVIRKFSLGGFSDSSNGIVNSAFVAPLTCVPSLKTSTTFTKNTTEGNAVQKEQESPEGEPQVNNKFALSSKLPEPLAIFSFTKDDISSLKAAIYQSYFEDRCSLEFSKAFLKKVRQTDDAFLKNILDRIKDETAQTESQLSLVENYLNSCIELNRSHNSLQFGLIKSQVRSKFSELFPDKLGLNGLDVYDPFALLQVVGVSLDSLGTKSNTALMTQLLYMAAMQMTNGSTSLLLGRKNAFQSNLSSLNVPDNLFIETALSNDTTLNLQTLSLSNNVNANQSFIYPSIESVPYGQKLKLGMLQDGRPFQKAAYLITLLANELAISTGLGKLEGTPLGQSFASTGNYKRNFWGYDSSVNDSTTEATSPGSLNDFFVVSETGTNRVSGQAGVILFDGSKQASTLERRNVYDAYVAGSIRAPLDSNFNKVQPLIDSQAAALSRFELGTQFYSQLHCRDGNVKLLTPRGLFTRLVKDFVDSLSLLQSKESASGKQVRELCLLSVLGRNALAGSQYGGSAVAIIKRSLLGLMSKKALQLQYGLDSPTPNVGANESLKPKSTSVSTKVTTKTNEGTSIAEVTAETFSTEQEQGGTFQFNPSPKNPRLCLDEKKLFDKRFQVELTDAVVIGFSELPVSKSETSQTFSNIDINVEKFYEDIFQNQDGLIDKLVKIYVDACDESSKILDASGDNSSAVDAARLTKNSQLDGTLLLALILEAACQLASDFVDAGISPDSGMQLVRAEYAKVGINDDKIKRNLLKFSQITLTFRAGEDTQSAIATRALGAICRASDGHDLSSVFLPKNGNLIVPELGAVPVSTSLSYDILGQTTISSVVDTFYDLSFERDLPALCFAVTQGMVKYFELSSAKYKDVASQLLGNKKQTEDSRRLADFATSAIGEKYFSSLNDFSLDASRKKLEFLKKEILSDSGRNSKITLGEFRCIQVLLDGMTFNNFTNNLAVVALPKDFVTKSLKSTYVINVDRNNPTSDQLMSIRVNRTPIFSQDSDFSDFRLFIRSPLGRESFAIFENRVPIDIDDILSNVRLDTGESGANFLQRKSDAGTATEALYNEIASYLLRRLFSTLSSADLFPDVISDYDAFPVDQNSTNIARVFAQAYGLSPSVFDGIFTNLPDGTTRIDEEKLLNLAKADFDLSSSCMDLALPPLKFGEAELFYDLFETVYFQSGAIQRRIFSVPLLDEISAVLLAPPSAEVDGQQTTTQGQIQANGVQSSLTGQASSKQVPQFDTYSLSISLATPLVNR